MFDHDSGGGGGGLEYNTFVEALFEKLGRFEELYNEKTSTVTNNISGGNPAPTPEQIAADADISSYVEPFLGARFTSVLVGAIEPDEGLLEDLGSIIDSDQSTSAGETSSKVEVALRATYDSVNEWEGSDELQFGYYLESVRLALHRQEAILDALRALADVHRRVVERTRQDLLDMLDAANEALANSDDFWGDGGASGALTIIGAGFAIGATLATGGAATGLAIASALVGTSASFIPGDTDEPGEKEYGFNGIPTDIRETTIELIGEIKTDVKTKLGDIDAAASTLRTIASSGWDSVSAKDLLPLEPDVYVNFDPEEFKLPDNVPVRP